MMRVMKLRDYQRLILSDAKYGLKTNDIMVSIASMGAGKSLIIAQGAKDYAQEGKTVVILVNISELIPQLKEYLDIFKVSHKIIKSGYELDHTQLDKSVSVWLIMEQSYNERKQKKIPINCDILIKDEIHIGMDGKRFNEIKESLNPSKILGFSGTPFSEQGYLIDGVDLHQLIHHGNAQELTDLGYLVPLHYYSTKLSEDIDYKDIKISGSDYTTKSLNSKLNSYEHIEIIVKSMNEMNAKNKKTLVYAISIEHAVSINKELLKNGYKSVAIHSKNDNTTNDNAIKNFDKKIGDIGSIDCLVSVSKLTTGFNKPNVNLLVLCRPTKVLRLYLQIIFRAARPDGVKKFAEILDLAQCVREHGFGTEPRAYIKKGNISGIKKEKDKHTLNVIKTMVTNKPTKLDINKVKVKMRSYRSTELELEEKETPELIKLFESYMEPYVIAHIALEMQKRICGITYNTDTIEKLSNSTIEDLHQWKLNLKKRIKERKIL